MSEGEPQIVLDGIPDSIAEKARAKGISPESVIVAVRSGLDLEGRPRSTWLLATPDGLTVINGRPAHTDIRESFSFDEIEKVRTYGTVGSSFLQVRVDGLYHSLVRYSNAQRELFERLAVELKRRLDGEPIRVDALLEPSPFFCSTCGFPLTSKGGECPRCIPQGGLFVRTIQLMRDYMGWVMVLILLMVAGVGFDLMPPYLTKVLVDDVLTKQPVYETESWVFSVIDMQQVFEPLPPDEIPNPNGLIKIVFILLGAYLLRQVLNIFIGRISAMVGTRITYDVRRKMHDKLLRLSVDFYDRISVGSLISRMRDVEVFHAFVIEASQGFLVNILHIIGIGSVLFWMQPTLAFYVLIPIPFVVWGTLFFWRRIFPMYFKFWDAHSKLGTMLSGFLSGIRLVKAFAQEGRESRRFDNSSDYLQASHRNVGLSVSTFNPIMGFVFSLGGVIIWYVGGSRVQQGGLTLGVLMAFFGYLGMFYAPISRMTLFSNWLASFMAGTQRVFEILDTESNLPRARNPVRLDRVRGRIEFRNVTFGYDPYTPVIKDISFTIEPGQMIGIVGKSGSGKTTLMNLLCRFYDPQQGQVLIDDVDVRELDIEQLRRKIGLVLQEPFLFRASIAENISYGNPSAEPLEIIRSAKAANCHEFVMQLPGCYDTRLGERGAGLSGGERQRVSIARALLCDPPILVLDEATSSVDTESEQKIQDALLTIRDNRTVIAIAHRLSTLKNSDRIFVIDGGELRECGTHEELMAREGIYHKLVMIQTKLTRLEE